jgi:Tfp pilus assembly protein PilF
MHKYRFRIDLWKQYLAFCHAIKSKKAFYKALTNAVRFNPFSLELWLAGAYYEFEVIKNPWKARKIFHKALKLNKSNIDLWKEYLRFEC